MARIEVKYDDKELRGVQKGFLRLQQMGQDYALLPEIERNPTLALRRKGDPQNTVIIIKKGKALYQAVLKAAAAGGRETFLTSFHRTDPKKVRRLISEGEVLFGECEGVRRTAGRE